MFHGTQQHSYIFVVDDKGLTMSTYDPTFLLNALTLILSELGWYSHILQLVSEADALV